MTEPTKQRLVTVCSECHRASCWHGEEMCSKARGAGTVEKTVGYLQARNLEHPENYSEKKVKEVCGD